MAKRVDGNQRLIVAALRDIGASVQHLHTQGHGCPDVLVGFRGTNFLLEIKDSAKPASARHLTVYESQWHQAWQGQVAVVNDVDEALAAIGAL